MIIGIHPDRIGTESYSDKWREFLHARDVEVKTLDLLAPDPLEQARTCDGIMWRWAHHPQDKQSAQRILHIIEHYLKIPVYPDLHTSWHYDEKVAQFYLLSTLNAPVPKTWLFWDLDQALEWAKTAPYPVVFKLSPGAGSSNVLKVCSYKEAERLTLAAFRRGFFPMTMNEYRPVLGLPRNLSQLKSLALRAKDGFSYAWSGIHPPLHPHWWKPEFGYIYFQEFLPDNAYDTRITIIGDRAFGFRRMNRPDDFRASGSGRIEYDAQAIDKECIRIAFDISERGKFQSMAYDFLYNQAHPVISEISYAYADWAVHNCPGHFKRDLTWVEGQMWPEQAQVEDFVGYVNAYRVLNP
jgi:glutathione synthase/RimK-type ligase-like ATP-grasp enzyme